MSEHVVSLSGGKDSTALFLMMLEKGMQVDEAVFFDTGWEFPQMYDHLDRLEKETGFTITRLQPPVPFYELMLINHRTRGKRVEMQGGYGYPTPLARWCTTEKTRTLDKHFRGRYVEQYVGIAADEAHRVTDKPNFHYPLVEWGITEKDALAYCKQRGYTWGGLYDHFTRVSCWLCPLQSLQELKNLRTYHPDLWVDLLVLDFKIQGLEACEHRFRADYSLPQLEQRFRTEDRQRALF